MLRVAGAVVVVAVAVVDGSLGIKKSLQEKAAEARKNNNSNNNDNKK